MRQFHKLKVSGLGAETTDSIRVQLQVPEALLEQFTFLPGQHLPIQVTVDGKKIRRTYSICSAPGGSPLEIGIRVQPGGRFSGYVASELAVGDELDVMPPFGQFHTSPHPARARTCVAYAAGSGITPILSIMRATLEQGPHTQVVLFYGNRRQRTTMFIDDLYALKNRYPERLQLYFLFSREEQEFPIFSGRLDGPKVRELWQHFCASVEPDEAFICGPDTMIETVSAALGALGFDAGHVHSERYGAPRKVTLTPIAESPSGHDTEVTVIMDGHRKTFGMAAGGASIVDAAAEQGIDLPYSCKGGVCATCRTHVADGEVQMQANFGLESWEIEQGYVLACQSRPLSEHLVLDYDKT